MALALTSSGRFRAVYGGGGGGGCSVVYDGGRGQRGCCVPVRGGSRRYCRIDPKKES